MTLLLRDSLSLSQQLFAVATTLKSIDYNAAMTFILNNNKFLLTEITKCLTSIRHQELHQVFLLFGENFDEVVEIKDTSARNKLEQFIVAVTSMYNLDNVFSLQPRDRSSGSELSHKLKIWVHAIQQLNTINSQLPDPSSIQRTNVPILSTNICSSNCTVTHHLTELEHKFESHKQFPHYVLHVTDTLQCH